MHDPVFSRFAPAPVGPYSQAVRAGKTLYGAGQLGLDPATGRLAGDTAAQAGQALRNIEAVLAAAGASMRDVVRMTVYLVDLGEFAAVNAIYAGFFADNPPARSTVQVAALPLGGRVEMDFIAVLP
ncbi:MAG: Rid family detoxifying hydrolase [Clostridia bacterium]|nr:Rid family detoxifying hydrolase [Clostridia bacterium]